MQEYNRMISSRILGNVDGMIDTLPQPTMFGGKRQRDFVLPASTEYDYPATLSVGHLNTSGMPRTLGGSFWTDFGEKEYLDEDNDEYQLEGGAVYIGEDGQVHSTGRIMPRNMVGADPRTYTPMGLKKVGGKINKRLLEGVLKVATKTGTTLGKPFEKTIQINPFTFGYDIGQDIIGPAIVHAMGRETEEEYNARKAKESKQAKGGRRNKGFLKSVGKVMGAVGKELAPVAKEVFRDVIIPEGKKALREYIKNMGKSSVEGEGGDEVVYATATPYYGKGKNRRNPPPNSVRPQSSPQSRADKVASMIGRDYSTFSSSKVKNASDWIKKEYPSAPKRKGKKKKVELVIDDEFVDDEERFEITPKPRGRPKKSGGALIRDIPSQFHSSVYPPALASYTAGRDAYGRGKSIGKSIGNFAKQAVRGFDDGQEYSANQIEKGLGKKGSKKVGDFRGGARNVRGAIVKEVMAKHGLSLPEASKFVKENNLY